MISNKPLILADAADFILAGDSDNADALSRVSLADLIGGGVGVADSVRVTCKVNEAGGVGAGQVLYISGATGGFPQVSVASNADFAKADVLAISNEAKTDGQQVIVTILGMIENIDTSAFSEGDILYLGLAGALTAIHPTGIDAVQRVGHAVKINASTGSVLVELDPLTVVNDHDGTVRHQLVNLNAGLAAGVTYTLVNDANHRASISLFGSNAVQEPEAVAYYNQGYGSTFYNVDGNKDHVWLTDITDAHAFASTIKMTLTAAGDLTVVGDISGSNLSGTNTGDQTSIVGISGTKAEFSTAVTDGTPLFDGDITSYSGDIVTSSAFTAGEFINSVSEVVDGIVVGTSEEVVFDTEIGGGGGTLERLEVSDYTISAVSSQWDITTAELRYSYQLDNFAQAEQQLEQLKLQVCFVK